MIHMIKPRLLATLLAVLFIIPASAQRMDFEFQDARGQAGFNLSQESLSGISVFHTVPKLSLYDFEVENESFKMIDMAGVFLPNNEGAPNLPGNGRFVALPKGARAQLTVHSVKKKVLQNIDLMPAPNIPMANEDEPLRYEKDMAIYGKDAWYPANPFQLSEPASIRGVDVVMLGVTPFQYNPVSKELIIYYDVDLEVSFEGGAASVGENRLRSRWWDPILQDALINPDQLPAIDYAAHYSEALHSRSTGYEYIIIVPDDPDFIAWGDSIRIFRNRQGIKTEVVTTTEIGGNNHTLIKNYISDAYNIWDLPPAAVLLLADYGTTGNTITSEMRYDHPYGGSSAYISDHYYADMTGNHMPDITMARITARNASELEIMVNKFLHYERTPPENQHYYDHPITAMGWQTERWFQLCSETVNGFWEFELGKEPLRQNNIYSGTPGSTWSTATNTATVVNTFGPAGLNYIPATPAHLHDFGWSANASSLNAAINAGAFMVLHRDHGTNDGWGEPHYRNQHLSGLSNEDLTFVFSINCLTGKFNWTGGESFTEALHRHPQAALGVTAATEISYSFVNDTYVWGLFNNMWPGFLPAHGTTPSSRDVLPAFGNSAGKYFLQQSNWPYNTQHKMITYYLFHHHGDAFSTVYTQMPQELEVDHMQAILSSMEEVEVTANAGALIALSVDNELIGVGVAGEDPISIPISMQLPGEQILVTVTMQDHYRYESYISVIPPEGPYLISTGTEINDEQGNANGIIDYNEIIDLGVELKNIGVETATGITSVLTTDSPYVNLLENEQDYEDLEPDHTTINPNAYTFHVSDSVPDNTQLSFNLEVAGNEDVWSTSFKLTARAPVFEINSFMIDDEDGNNNGRLDPGETADILIDTYNAGGSDAIEAFAEIMINDPYVTVNSSTHAFGTFDFSSTQYAAFNVTVSENTPLGYAFAFDYMVESGHYSAQKSFHAKVGLVLEDFETGDFSQFDWEFSGHEPWTITALGAYEGQYAAKSGNISHNQQTRMGVVYDVGAADSISFYRRVSSEANYDHLKFYINNMLVGQWSGNVPWGKVSFPVSPGRKTFVWEYAKDPMVSSGADAAWVDMISFPPPVATTGYAGEDAFICENESYQLEATAENYTNVTWTTDGTGQFDDPNILNPVYTPGAEDIEAGAVTLTFYAEGDNNNFTDNLLLTIYKIPTALAGEDMGVCTGQPVELNEAMAANFEALYWETTGTGSFDDPTALNPVYNPSVEDYTTGIVDLHLTAFGYGSCGDAIAQINIEFFDNPTAEIHGDQTICHGQSAELHLELGGAAPWTISLNDGLGTHQIAASPYTLEVIPDAETNIHISMLVDNNGCEGETTGQAVVAMDYSPTAPIQPAGHVAVDHHLEAQSVYVIDPVNDADMYTWVLEPEEAGSLTEDGIELNIQWNTDYIGQAFLYALAGNHCGLSDASTALEIELYSTLGLNELHADGLLLYPNPSDGLITLSFLRNQHEEAMIRISNMLGETVHTELMPASNSDTHVLNLGHLGNGTYVLSIENKHATIYKRIVIRK